MIIPDEIDVEIVEAIILEGNRQEWKWLRDQLEKGIKVRNTTGRIIKSDSFLLRIK